MISFGVDVVGVLAVVVVELAGWTVVGGRGFGFVGEVVAKARPLNLVEIC